VTLLTVTKNKSVIALSKNDGKWTISNQETVELDQGKVDQLVRQASRIYAMGFEPSGSPFPEAKIQLKVTIETSEGQTVLEFAPSPTDSAVMLARKGGDTQVYRVAASTVDASFLHLRD
jgi:hypothetical protein